MRSIFKSPMNVTQNFGVNKDYYKQFGLPGHEGLDVIPQDLSNWTVVSPFGNGQIVKDVDNPKDGGAYGNTVTIWYPDRKIALQFAHFAENYVKIGDKISEGQAIGKMGSTGNTNGAHVHINYFQVDESGYRLNKDNGFLGGLDPLKVLAENDEQGTYVDKPTFTHLVEGSTVRKELAQWLKDQGATGFDDPDNTPLEKFKSYISGLKSRITSLDSLIKEKDSTIAQLNTEITNQKDKLANKLEVCQREKESLEAQITALKKGTNANGDVVNELTGQISTLEGKLREAQKTIGERDIEIAKLKSEGGTDNQLLDAIANFISKLLPKIK